MTRIALAEQKQSTWLVELIGDRGSIELLSSFLSSPDLGIANVDGKSFLGGLALEAASSAANAHALAVRLLKAVNGLCVLAGANFRPASIGNQVFRRDASGKPRWVSSFMDATVYIPEKTYSWDSASPASPTPEWAQLALSNPEFQKALGYLAQGEGADDLYRVFEAAEAALGGESAITARKLATGKEIELFKRTMNASGVGFGPARHGKSNRKPPPKPMLLPDAKRFIQALLSAWVEDEHHERSST